MKQTSKIEDKLDTIIFPNLAHQLELLKIDFTDLMKNCVAFLESQASKINAVDVFEIMELMVILLNKKNLYFKSKRPEWNIVQLQFWQSLSGCSRRFNCSYKIKEISKRIVNVGNSLLLSQNDESSDDDSDDSQDKDEPLMDKLDSAQKRTLEELVNYHKNQLKPSEISDLARELRGAASNKDGEAQCPEEDLLTLESICLQLSQQRTIEHQIQHFLSSQCQKSFNRICLDMKYPKAADFLDKDKIKLIQKILETIVPQTSFVFENGETYVDKYYIESILCKKWKKLYYPVAHGINCMLTRSKSYKIQISVLKLLKRLYCDIVPAEWKHILEDTIITNLENISEISNIQKHKQAALFYYKMLNLPKSAENEKFVEKLKSN